MKHTPYRLTTLSVAAPLGLLLLSVLWLPLSAAAVDSEATSTAATTTTQIVNDTATAPKAEPAAIEDKVNTSAELNRHQADLAAAQPQAASSDTRLDGKISQATPDHQSSAVAAPQSQPAAIKAPEKTIFGLPLDYILAAVMALLALLALGWGFLLSQLRALAHENHHLSQDLTKLTAQVTSNNKKIKVLTEDNLKLKQALRHLADRPIMPDLHPSNNNSTPVTEDNESLINTEIPTIGELDITDRKRLADVFTKWLTTNRGNNKIEEVLPADIHQKLMHWHYRIQFWAQGDGVDDIKPTKNPMYASVISITKPDQHGIAYCYNKPNSLSLLWKNQTWYEVQHTGQTLNVSGTLLETV